MGAPGLGPEGYGISPAQICAELRKILSSSVFTSAGRLSRLLDFLVREGLNGREPSEYSIGLDLLGREPETFDPRVDPIVRVQVGRLRARLKEYYAGDGAADSVEIEIPIRRYVPAFRTRSAGDANGLAARPAGETSIAVMPFVALSDEKEDEYFAEGLTDELLDALSRVPQLRVVALRSEQPLGSRPSAREAIRRLKVDVVLETRIRRAGDRVRVSAQLTTAADDSLVWSEVYERRIADLFSTQEEIAAEIAAALGIHVTVQAPARRPGSSAASSLYLKARYHRNKRTPEGLAKSIELLSQALAEEPQFASAYAGLAEAWVLMAMYGHARPREVMPQAKSAALKALELAPALPEAHTYLGVVTAMYDWDFKTAEQELQRGLQSAPGSADPLLWYGLSCLAVTGRLDTAVATLQRARDLEPLSLTIAAHLGDLYCAVGHYETALAHLEQAVELEAGFYLAHWSLGLVYGQLERYEEAIASLLRAQHLSGGAPFVSAALGYMYASAGLERDGERILNDLLERSRDTYVPALDLAMLHLGLGREEDALAWLENAFEERCAWLAWAPIDPRTRQWRTDPRFERLFRRINADAQ